MGNKRLRTKSACERTESKPQRSVNDLSGLRRVNLCGMTKQQQEAFYAGAKFDTVPGLVEIPVPPVHWRIGEGPRSQSTPSSPITVYGKAPDPLSDPPRGIKLDIESLFATKKVSTEFRDSELGRLLSASIPERGMRELSQKSETVPVVTSLEGVPRMGSVTSQVESVTSQLERRTLKKVSGISGQDLMELLKGSPRQTKAVQKAGATPVHKGCQFGSVDSHQYNDITNHLKSILNVSIAA